MFLQLNLDMLKQKKYATKLRVAERRYTRNMNSKIFTNILQFDNKELTSAYLAQVQKAIKNVRYTIITDNINQTPTILCFCTDFGKNDECEQYIKNYYNLDNILVDYFINNDCNTLHIGLSKQQESF